MRYVDIYQNNSVKTPAAFDCIQFGEVLLTRTPNASRFTMADGSPCMYAAACDTAVITLRLECSSRCVSEIACCARLGSFVIAGMSYGINRRTPPKETAGSLPQQSGIIGYITGGVQIEEISSGADLYAVSIPLQIVLNQNGLPSSVSVPAVHITSLWIDDHQEILSDANYRYMPVGTFIRKQILYTDFAETAIACTSDVPDQETLFTAIQRENADQSAPALLTGDAAMKGMLSLLPGRNDFILTVRKADNGLCKPQSVRFSIYRDTAADDRCALRLNDGRLLTTRTGKILTVKERD